VGSNPAGRAKIETPPLGGFFLWPERANSLAREQESKGDGDALSEAKSRRASVAGRDRILPGAAIRSIDKKRESDIRSPNQRFCLPLQNQQQHFGPGTLGSVRRQS
jgi:hypothetical protein